MKYGISAFLLFPTFHCSRQDNRKIIRNKRKRKHVEYHAKRDKKRKETNDKRSSQSIVKISTVEERDDEAATEAIGTSYKETRHIVADTYRPPLFQMGDLSTIMKDSTPGVHWRFSYDNCGWIS